MTADIERHIVALDRAWEDAIINEDADELDRLGADDLIYTHAGGCYEGKEGFLGHITDGPLRFPVIEYADTEVRLHGDCAVLTCELHLQTLDREGAVGTCTSESRTSGPGSARIGASWPASRRICPSWTEPREVPPARSLRTAGLGSCSRYPPVRRSPARGDGEGRGPRSQTNAGHGARCRSQPRRYRGRVRSRAGRGNRGETIAGRRDRLLIASKCRAVVGDGPNDGGLSRHHIIESVERSLRRLGTDHIDLYQAHGWDGETATDETVRALDQLVQDGKVRYLGCSNYSAWHIMKSLGVADRLGTERFVSQQISYSIIGRDAENELVPLSLDQGVGILITGALLRVGCCRASTSAASTTIGCVAGESRRCRTPPASTTWSMSCVRSRRYMLRHPPR